MIKGHTKIELKDEATGEVKTVEQDNMLTNAIAELSKPLCEVSGISKQLYAAYKKTSNVAEILFGGIILFEELLSSDQDDYMWPIENPCTGFAGDFVYSGINPNCGSYNEYESGLQEDGSYKHVWDFATHSCNGTISSLGLTSTYSARIGLGSLMYDFDVAYYHTAHYVQDMFRTELFTFRDLYIKDGFLYYVPLSTFEGTSNVYNSGGIFTINKVRVPVGFVGLTTSYAESCQEYIEIQLPSDFVNQFNSTSASINSMSVEYKDGIITLAYVSHSSNLAAGGTCKLCHINCNENFSTYTTTFTNTTGYTISRLNYKHYSSIKAMHDYCIVNANNDGGLYIINTNDCTDVKRVQLNNGENITLGANHYLRGTLFTDDNAAVVLIGNSTTSSDSFFGLFINLKTGKASYANIQLPMTAGSGYIAYDSKGLLGMSSYSSDSILHAAFINPFFLTTKNNLSEPVVKTATQSMKITYTLREG